MKTFAVPLQARILMIVLAVVGLYAAVDYASQRFFVLPGFIALEQNEAQNTMRRCLGAIKRQISGLEKSAKEWATSKETWQFLNDRNDAYVRTHLTAASFIKNNLNFIRLSDTEGKMVWGEIRDLQTREVLRLSELPPASRPEVSISLLNKSSENCTAGICTTRQKIMLTASCPITGVLEEGPARGTFTVGKFLNDTLVDALAEQTAAEFKVWMVTDNQIPTAERQVLSQLNADSNLHIRELSEDRISVYTFMPDAHGVPALLMRVDLPRDIKSKAIAGFIRSNLLSNLMAGLIVLLVLWMLLRNTVVGPIAKLTSHVTAIGTSDNFTARFTLDRTDEIGTLAREFDRMVQQLAESRRKLSEQCYNLGKAEVASGVLHNARNVLTPLVSRIGGLREKLREVPLEKIEAAQAELEKYTGGAKRTEDIGKFVSLSCKNLAEFVRSTRDRLDDIAKLVAQIEEMLAQQGIFSHAKLPAEEVKLSHLLRDSIALLPRYLTENTSIEVDPSIKAIAPMMVHSITVLQVFNNVLLNAAESIYRAGISKGCIRIRANIEQLEGSDMIDVQIHDNGQGITPANLQRVFERGFSTKHNIPSGIGLHWCANAVAMMNGQIRAESPGAGQGATFHILLPVSNCTDRLLHEPAEVRA